MILKLRLADQILNFTETKTDIKSVIIQRGNVHSKEVTYALKSEAILSDDAA